MVAWTLGVRMAPVTESVAPPVVLLQAPSIYRPYEADPEWDGSQAVPQPLAGGLAITDREGDWVLRTSCR